VAATQFELIESSDWNSKIKQAIQFMAGLEQTPMPLKHYFLPGVYIREIFMPAGTFVIGKKHKTQHFNIVLQGEVALIGEGGVKEVITAPHTFISNAGVQKALYIYRDCVWQTVHLTSERDMDALEAQLIEPDDYPVFDRTEERAAIAAAAKAEPLQLEHAS
jgi:hypothetical protein